MLPPPPLFSDPSPLHPVVFWGEGHWRGRWLHSCVNVFLLAFPFPASPLVPLSVFITPFRPAAPRGSRWLAPLKRIGDEFPHCLLYFHTISVRFPTPRWSASAFTLTAPRPATPPPRLYTFSPSSGASRLLYRRRHCAHSNRVRNHFHLG